MPVMRCMLSAFLVSAFVGCGGASASTSSNRSIEETRAAAVRLLFADANTTARPRAYEITVLRRRMREYVASRWLDRRVEQTARAIKRVLGRRYWQPWTEAITVGRWEATNQTDESATVKYVGYDTICPTIPPKQLPMERVTVRMVRERGMWRLVDYTPRWLNGAGPMGIQGNLTIRALPLRVVFRNPPPRTWRYRGPHFARMARCD